MNVNNEYQDLNPPPAADPGYMRPDQPCNAGGYLEPVQQERPASYCYPQFDVNIPQGGQKEPKTDRRKKLVIIIVVVIVIFIVLCVVTTIVTYMVIKGQGTGNNITNKTNVESKDPDRSVCAPGYSKVLSSCYKTEVIRRTGWTGAVSRCHEDDAHLVTIETKQEWLALLPVIPQGVNESALPYAFKIHTGAIFEPEKGEGYWVYPGGEKRPLEYTNWCYFVNLNKTSEWATVVTLSWTNALCWVPHAPNEVGGYICEKEL